jgi:hypothetical protein
VGRAREGHVEMKGVLGTAQHVFCRYKATREHLPRDVDDIIVAANGIAFTAPHIRKGVLPRMLREILETRVMVKGGLKSTKHNRILHRRLNARQFALKLIANVTYGYTAAGESPSAFEASVFVVCMFFVFQLWAPDLQLNCHIFPSLFSSSIAYL